MQERLYHPRVHCRMPATTTGPLRLNTAEDSSDHALLIAQNEIARLSAALNAAEERNQISLDEEQRLRSVAQAAESNLRAVFAASPEPIVVLDLTGIVLSWNQAAERTLGWRESDVIGKALPIIPVPKQESANGVFQRLLKGETITGMEAVRRRRDGSSVVCPI